MSKKCPFCGGVGRLTQVFTSKGCESTVRCDKCGAEGPYGQSDDDAVRLWEERV